jgi:hypothetical protein
MLWGQEANEMGLKTALLGPSLVPRSPPLCFPPFFLLAHFLLFFESVYLKDLAECRRSQFAIESLPTAPRPKAALFASRLPYIYRAQPNVIYFSCFINNKKIDCFCSRSHVFGETTGWRPPVKEEPFCYFGIVERA